jgi:hypothetical protein
MLFERPRVRGACRLGGYPPCLLKPNGEIAVRIRSPHATATDQLALEFAQSVPEDSACLSRTGETYPG